MNKVLGFLVAITFAGFVQAEGFMPWTKVTAMADLNDDGMITMFEIERFKPVANFPGFQPFMADHFIEFDANNDGMVDMAELEKAKEAHKMSDEDMSQAFFKRQGFMPNSK